MVVFFIVGNGSANCLCVSFYGISLCNDVVFNCTVLPCIVGVFYFTVLQ